MDSIINYVAIPFGYVIEWCYRLFNDYGLAIIFFTFLTKVIQLPLTIWIQYNSIKMVKIQPEINRIHVKYFGDGNAIAEEESKMYKREKYNPFLTLIPLLIQVILLLGVAAAINGIKDGISYTGLENFSPMFLGMNLSDIPAEILFKAPVIALAAPIIAGFSAWFLCFCQNKSNVLQAEQGNFNKYGLMILSVALSLYLGYFVSLGIALYWVFSNLFSTLQLYIINFFIPPKKYVDYEDLEASRKELQEIKATAKADVVSPEDKKREKADYKRFFSIADKHLVFYSERSGFYKYYEDIIEGLLKRCNMNIHYITNDPDDMIFEKVKENDRIKPYYISVKKMITLFMKMDADIVIMTTPDLDQMYLKKSMVRKDIEYIYVPHDPVSIHYSFHENAFDNFDTMFATGPHIEKECRASEKIYNTKEKTIVEFGYPLIEKLCKANEALSDEVHEKKQILIAPSWQEDNLLDSCIDDLINGIYSDDYKIIVRPHPEYIKRFSPKMDMIVERFKDKVGENLIFELDFSSNKSVYSSDLLITDWSGIGPEFSISTLKPALFINTKPKMENENYEKIGIVPQDIALRDIVGKSVNKEDLVNVKDIVNDLISDTTYKEKLLKLRETYFYNFGSNGKYGVTYLLSQLKKKQERK